MGKRPAKQAEPKRSDALLSAQCARSIGPRTVVGENRTEWENIQRRWRNGELNHLTKIAIHQWCVENLGFTCDRFTTSTALGMPGRRA